MRATAALRRVRIPLPSASHSPGLNSLLSTWPHRIESTTGSCQMSELGECAASGAGAAAPVLRGRAKDRRASACQKVREIRARLVHGRNGKPDFEYELLCMLARAEISSRVALPLLAAIFSLASTFWAPVAHAAAWLGAVVAMKLIVVTACHRLLARPRGEVD